MRVFDLWHVDVFAESPLEGNPLAVFPRAAGLTDAEMLSIAREMNLSETTFVLPPSDPKANYRNRIFTPGGELPFAGHPSLGTAFVAALEGIVPLRDGASTVHQEVGIGVLPLELHARQGIIDRVVMTQGTPKVGKPITSVGPIAKALGLKESDITATKLRPALCSTGVPSLQVPVRSLDLMADLAPDAPLLSKALRQLDRLAGAYVFSLDAEDADLHARAFFPNHGIIEDPATGSAAGACGAYLAANKKLPPGEWMTIEQGREVHHPSRIEVAVTVERGRPVRVRVAGRVIPVMRGTLSLP